MNELQPDAKALLNEAVLARIATVNPRTLQPHVVPVWFLWDGQALYISAFDSTRKMKDLRRNPRISVLIEPATIPDGALQALLLEGQVTLIKDPQQVAQLSLLIYTKYMGDTGVQAESPQSWLRDPENTIIQLIPDKIYRW